MPPPANFQWNGPAVQAQLTARVAQELDRMGGFLETRMQGYAPVDTGMLRAGIHHQVDGQDLTLTVYIPAPYAVYQEFGTRFIPPHPYTRPAVIDAAAIWHFTDVVFYLHPPPQRSQPIRATPGGFRLPRKRPLTPKQLAHVRRHLIPTSRNLAAKFRRRQVKFRVIGPP